MEAFRVGAVQMNALKGKLERNLKVHRRFTAKAAKAGCRLVMFPELGLTAHYGEESVSELAQEADRGSIYEEMSGLARKHDIIISYGFCESAHGTHYNTSALMGPQGLIGIQRKVHASKDEYFSFRMGRSFEVFDLGFVRIGTLICADTSFFEAWRVLALKGAEVILLPHASRSGWGTRIPKETQKRQLRAALRRLPGRLGVYASDNNVFAVFANQVDYNGHSTHSGLAYVLGPDASVLAKSRAVLDDLMVTADLDPETQERRRRAAHSTLKMRRPETYGELTRMI